MIFGTQQASTNITVNDAAMSSVFIEFPLDGVLLM
jgi:hypothetical protein